MLSMSSKRYGRIIPEYEKTPVDIMDYHYEL
jgi:hypothetical protein